MASTYDNSLRLELIATGEAASTWGDKTNVNLTAIAAAFGYATQDGFAADANATTTVADGAADPARALYFKITSSATLTATRTLTIAPNTISRVMWIENATTGGQSIAISQGTGANVTIPTGKTAVVYLDGAGAGAAVVDAMASLNIDGSITAAAGSFTTGAFSGEITANGGIALGDNDKATFGASDDLQIYHDGTNSYIDEAGTGHLFVRSNGDGIYFRSSTNEEIAHFNVNGSVKLYHDNALKLATTSTGIDVTGAATFSGDVTADKISISNASGGNVAQFTDTTSADLNINLTSGVTLLTPSTGILAFGTNTTERMRLDTSGNLGIGAIPSTHRLEVKGDNNIAKFYSDATATELKIATPTVNVIGLYTGTADDLTFGTADTERMRLDTSGNLSLYQNQELRWQWQPNDYIRGAISVDASNNMSFQTAYVERLRINGSGKMMIGQNTNATGLVTIRQDPSNHTLSFVNTAGTVYHGGFYGGGVSGLTTGYSVTASYLYLSKDTGTSRSINAAGTINASGADYAEYEQNNGLTISKGSVVGFKADGTLTLIFSEAVRFAIKSTDPAYVGGDSWGTKDAIGPEPTAPDEDAEQSVIDQYEDDLTTYKAVLEAARQLVDRIAYSGKVPVNIQGATAGDYIIAVAADDGSIDGQAVSDPDFSQYKLSVGRVNRILEDGRAEVAVIIH